MHEAVECGTHPLCILALAGAAIKDGLSPLEIYQKKKKKMGKFASLYEGGKLIIEKRWE